MMIQCVEGTAEKGLSRNVLFLRYGHMGSVRLCNRVLVDWIFFSPASKKKQPPPPFFFFKFLGAAL